MVFEERSTKILFCITVILIVILCLCYVHSQEIVDLGYCKVRELKEEDPEIMYQNLMALRGHHISRLRCPVFGAREEQPEEFFDVPQVIQRLLFSRRMFARQSCAPNLHSQRSKQCDRKKPQRLFC